MYTKQMLMHICQHYRFHRNICWEFGCTFPPCLSVLNAAMHHSRSQQYSISIGALKILNKLFAHFDAT